MPGDSTALRAIEPAGSAMVRIEHRLVEDHRAPWWVHGGRLALVAAAALGLPASGALLLGLVVVVWIASGLVVRYPVRLAPGRALFEGGLGSTDRPGRYWLRWRRSESAYSIALEPLRLRWEPAPTRLQGPSGEAWLELRLERWVRPRADEAGQFVALMQYHLWHEHPSALATRLRAEVLEGVVEAIDQAGLVDGLEGHGRDVAAAIGPALGRALDGGLHALGLESVAQGAVEARLVPKTEDLSSEDRVWLDRTPPP